MINDLQVPVDQSGPCGIEQKSERARAAQRSLLRSPMRKAPVGRNTSSFMLFHCSSPQRDSDPSN